MRPNPQGWYGNGRGLGESAGKLWERSQHCPPPSSSPPLSPTSLNPCWPPWNFQKMTYVSEPPLWFPLLTLPSPQLLVISAYQIRPVSAIRVFSGAPPPPCASLIRGTQRVPPASTSHTIPVIAS